MREVKDAASTLGIEITPLEVRRSEDIAPALEGLKADALYVIGTALLTSNVPIIITLALSARLPTMFGASEYVRQGALISYAPNFPDLFRRSAEYVDKILRGAKPGDLPVEQPTKFDLAVNLKTAKAIGVTIPGIVLARADQVIE
jgi:putative ABC transport system substrate-binding protein